MHCHTDTGDTHFFKSCDAKTLGQIRKRFHLASYFKPCASYTADRNFIIITLEFSNSHYDNVLEAVLALRPFFEVDRLSHVAIGWNVFLPIFRLPTSTYRLAMRGTEVHAPVKLSPFANHALVKGDS